MLKILCDYYDYSEWANGRILDAAEGIDEEQFLTSDLPGIWSIRDTLAHIMISQWAWTERWHGRSPATYPQTTDFPDLASIRTFWAATYASMNELLEKFDEQQLIDQFPYTNARGEQWSYPLWEELFQVANHSTYHRGEVAALLTRFGRSPGELDFLVWRDSVKAGT